MQFEHLAFEFYGASGRSKTQKGRSSRTRRALAVYWYYTPYRGAMPPDSHYGPFLHENPGFRVSRGFGLEYSRKEREESEKILRRLKPSPIKETTHKQSTRPFGESTA
jgi:hypothetical protein